MTAVLIASLVAVALVITATAIWSRRTGIISVVDTMWGLFFVAVGWAVALAGGFSARSVLLAVLASVWGLRLAWHIGNRARGHGEDYRYVELSKDVPPEKKFAWAVKRVFVTQGVVAWFVALPLTVAATTDKALGWVAWVGVVIWAAGLFFEAVGDAQLKAFKADPANKGKIMDRGLWAWTRHPNYFGDSTVWWGLWVIAAEAWPGVLTILSPIAMTYFLAFRTGAKLLEKAMSKRPGYPDYMERTSGFFPLPPKRRSRS